MKKAVLVILVSLTCGFAVARLMFPDAKTDEPDGITASPNGKTAAATLETRLRSLEQALADERQARQLLQDELVFLTEEMESLRAGMVVAPTPAVANVSAGEAPPRQSARQRYASRNSPADRVQRLVDAGFSPDRAESIVQRESQYRMETMEARYDAQRSGDFESLEQVRNRQSDAFRNELGADEYERYLQATGRSTSVAIGGVIGTSPAQRAGLKPGDSIINYDGKRVYNMSDLNRATLEGEVGETVVVEVVRDGVVMQVALPRGPLGVTRASRRR